MSFVQTLKTEAKDFCDDVDKLFNNLGADIEKLKAELQGRVDTLKNNVDQHCRAHTAQTLSDAGKIIPHDTKPAEQAAEAQAANPAPAPVETIVGSDEAVAAAKAAETEPEAPNL